jgi:hypothetical protein
MTRCLLYGIIFLALMIAVFDVRGQNILEVALGLGYYELTHAGVYWGYSEKSSVGIYAGTNFEYEGKRILSLGLSYSQVFPKPLLWKLKPGFSIKPQFWTQDDENYYFSNLALITQLGLHMRLNRFVVGLEGGGVLNYTVKTDRKQNVTAGSPSRANGNFNFSIRYQIAGKP